MEKGWETGPCSSYGTPFSFPILFVTDHHVHPYNACIKKIVNGMDKEMKKYFNL